MNIVKTKVRIAGIDMDPPILNASGTVDPLQSQSETPIETFGAYATKTVTLNPKAGNRPPRNWEIRHEGVGIGVLNSIGLQNEGVNSFINNTLPRLRELGVPIIVSIGGKSIDEFMAIAGRLDDVEDGFFALEVNISCPNVDTGMKFGQNHIDANVLITQIKKTTHMPLIVKLTPNVTNIASIARAVEDAGVAAISAVNTFEATDINIDTWLPEIGNIKAGYSGPAILPQALAKVRQIAQAVDIPVVGMGGISCWQDAIKFFLFGASAVAIGTYNFHDPEIIPKIAVGIREYLLTRGIKDIKDIIGKIKIEEE